MAQPIFTPPANIYRYQGKFFYVCGTYKSMCYDDLKRLNTSLKQRFPAAEIKDAQTEANPIDFSPERK